MFHWFMGKPVHPSQNVYPPPPLPKEKRLTSAGELIVPGGP